ncbi:hypothetical protein BDQ12DRAFT_672549 [Crucibulum laeve]|uniref:Uncharacterized protein n=1 Tax=Crucibulum laeve TaxID=68775 RepID=A0A5C3MFL5_9AGAR|nr:hypothetical protein BDQ12DRAFT_672549 [Crucibulum laeve]
MRSSTFFRSATLFAIIAVAFAANICAYTSRDCIGSCGCCTNTAEGSCCYWPSNSSYGWSVRFSNMPSTPYWLGLTYGDFCWTQTSGAGSSSGSVCSSVYPAPNRINWVSANWDADYRTRRSVDVRGDDCVVPDTIGFTNEDGKEHLVKVPEGKFEDIANLIETLNFEALLKFERAK